MDNKRRAALLADEFAIKFGLGSSFAAEALWLRERVERALNQADMRGVAGAGVQSACYNEGLTHVVGRSPSD